MDSLYIRNTQRPHIECTGWGVLDAAWVLCLASFVYAHFWPNCGSRPDNLSINDCSCCSFINHLLCTSLSVSQICTALRHALNFAWSHLCRKHASHGITHLFNLWIG